MKDKYSFQPQVEQLFIQLDMPRKLMKHLTIVYQTAIEILNGINDKWPGLNLNSKEILFGAATHDIGKCVEQKELYEHGSMHLRTGYDLLISKGVDPELARFTITHNSSDFEKLRIEDIIVILADKLWKGKRINELEEVFISRLALMTNTDFWNIYPNAEMLFSKIVEKADKRLLWQQAE